MGARSFASYIILASFIANLILSHLCIAKTFPASLIMGHCKAILEPSWAIGARIHGSSLELNWELIHKLKNLTAVS